MSHTQQIRDLWSTSSDRDLASLLREILHLMEEANSNGEELPLDLELEILLNANYAIGFGGTPSQTRWLADLYYRLAGVLEAGIKQSRSSKDVLSNLGIKIDHFHRLGCTVASASINILTSDEYHDETTAADIISWKDEDMGSNTGDIIVDLVYLLSPHLSIGEVSSWQLELFTFVLSLKLLYQDFTADQFPLMNDMDLDKILRSYLSSVDQSGDAWSEWKAEWLQKSDYYRFVTLMLAEKSVSEEYWISQVQSYLD